MNRIAAVAGAASLFVSTLGAAQPADAPRAEGAPGATAETAPQPAPATTPVSPSGGHIRWGITGGPGTFFPGPMVTIAAEGRIGWQFTSILGAYATVGFTEGYWFGGSLNVGSGGAGVSMNFRYVDYWQFGVEGEAILGNTFFVAAGPKIVKGGWGFVGQGVDAGSGGASAEQYAGIVSGWLPAVGTRIGLAFGKVNPATGKRGGFNMAIDTTFVFGSGGVEIKQSAGTTGVSQRVAPLGGIGITPILMFGYEMR